MTFSYRIVVFYGILIGAIESCGRWRVKAAIIWRGFRECFGKDRWL